jgi:hypothetical protein
VGDHIVSLMHGKGEVKSVNQNRDFPISIETKEGVFSFSENGNFFIFPYKIRFLYHSFENVRITTEPTCDPNEQAIKDLENEIIQIQNKIKTLKNS